MSHYYSFRPYVPVGEKRRLAAVAAKKLAKKGQPTTPVNISSRTIANTFWGKAWCDNLEAYSDFSNRLPRGRTYVRNGSVIDLKIGPGKVDALVQGSSLYKINIAFTPLSSRKWQDFKARSAGGIVNLLDLLQGRLSKELLGDITSQQTGLFPSPKEIKLGCSCPDWADMCKHVAAALYGVGARLDEKPELFFTLRGVDMQELITAATTTASKSIPKAGGTELAGSDLSQLFDVELEAEVPVTAARKATPKGKSAIAAPRATKQVKPKKKAAKLKPGTSAVRPPKKRLRQKPAKQ